MSITQKEPSRLCLKAYDLYHINTKLCCKYTIFSHIAQILYGSKRKDETYT